MLAANDGHAVAASEAGPTYMCVGNPSKQVFLAKKIVVEVVCALSFTPLNARDRAVYSTSKQVAQLGEQAFHTSDWCYRKSRRREHDFRQAREVIFQ